MTVYGEANASLDSSRDYDSLREFFSSLTFGTYVTIGEFGSQFIYTGKWKHHSHNEIALTVLRTLEPFYVNVEDDQQYWRICKNPDGSFMIADPLLVRALDQLYWQRRTADAFKDALTESEGIHDTLIEKLRNDFQTLNGLINKYADDQDMCSDYEAKLDEWNEKLSSESNLVGRLRDRSVKVRLTRTWEVWIDAEATSDDEARNIVERMDDSDVADKVMDAQSWPDTTEFRVLQVSS